MKTTKRFLARTTILARSTLSVLALAAFAPCADGDKSALRVTPSDSAAMAAAAATGTLESKDGDVRAVNYMLTSDRYRDWTRAQRDLDALPATSATDRLHLRGASDGDVERIVRRLEADPAARRAIEPSGLSVRDYVLTTLALAQAMDATENGGRTRLIGVPRENVDVYSRHRDDVRRFQRDARFRVVDDGDSDGDTDGQNGTNRVKKDDRDSDKKGDGDSDRRRGKGRRGGSDSH